MAADIQLGGSVGPKTVTGNSFDAAGLPAVNFPDPTNPQDVATKAYVDAHGGGPSYSTVSTSGTTTVTKPSSAWADVSVDTLTANAATTVKAWASAAVGNRITVTDSANNCLSKSLTFDGNGFQIKDPEKQTFTLVGTTYTYQYGGESRDWVLVQIPGRNSGNAYWESRK